MGMATASSGDLARRSRRHAPKVRTGCRSCKLSKVKCDEAKPQCGRCSRNTLECVYPFLGASQAAAAASRISSSSSSSSSSPSGLSKSSLIEPITTLVAGNPLSARDSQYFGHFRNHVIYQLGGVGFGDVWGRTILREAIRDPCVLNAILGLGALYRAKTSPAAAQLTIPLYQTRVDAPSAANRSPSHYYDALAYYTAAISRLQKRVAVNDPYTPRAVLILTILLSAFESLQGNLAAADQLMAHAIIALKNLLLRRGTTVRERDSLIAAPLDDEGVREAEFALVRIVTFNVAMTPFFPKAREAVLDLKFNYLDRAPHPPTIRECQMNGGSKVFWRDLIRLFTCQLVWGTHNRAIVHETLFLNPSLSGADFIAAIPDIAARTSNRTKLLNISAEWKDALNKTPQLVSDSDNSVLTKALARNLSTALKMNYWSFSTLVGHPSEHGMSRDYINAATALLDQSQRTIMHLPPSLRDEGTAHDGLIPTLAAQVQTNPHGTLRLRAFELWGKLVSPRSSWLVRGMYLGHKALVETEEAYRDDVTGFVPVNRKYNWTGGVWNDDYTQLEVTLTRLLPDEDGNKIIKTILVEVPT